MLCFLIVFVKEILEFRNKKAHEAVSDFKVLKENFNEIFNHFRWSDPNSLKFDEIQEVFNVAKEIKKRKTL